MDIKNIYYFLKHFRVLYLLTFILISLGSISAQTVYEAENGTNTAISNKAETNASGTVEYQFTAGGQSKITSVNGGAGGSGTILVRYSNGDATSKTLNFYTYQADGLTSVLQGAVTFPPTGSWTSFAVVACPYTMTFTSGTVAGNNFKLKNDAGATVAVEIDNYTVSVTGAYVAVSTVTPSPASASVNIGATTNLSATISPGNATNQTVSWSSSDTNIATVSSAGVVTGYSIGSATITATSQNESLTGTATITVNYAAVAATGVSVSPSSVTVVSGASTTLTATLIPAYATNKFISWTSSNSAVALVSPFGVVTGISAGTATITATTQDGSFTATSSITVSAVASNYVLNPDFEIGAPAASVTNWYEWSANGTDINNADIVAGNVGLGDAIGGAPHSGTYYYKIGPTGGNPTSYNMLIRQDFTGLPIGTYTLTGWFRGNGGGGYMNIGSYYSNFVFGAMTQWTQYTITNFQVTDGTATIMVDYNSNGGGYEFNIDDLKLTLNQNQVISNTQTASALTDPTENLIVTSTGVLTIDAPKTIQSVTVYPGGKLNLNSTLTIKGDLIIQSDKTSTASVNVSTAAALTGSLKLEKTLDNSIWYFVSFPSNVLISNIVKKSGTGTLTNGNLASSTGWWIKKYDGSARVSNLGTTSNWVNMASNATLTANVGYIIGLSATLTGDYQLTIPLTKTLVTSAETARTVGVTNYGEGSVAANHVGWNLVGIPYLSTFTGNNVGANYLTFYDGTSYSQLAKASATAISPYSSFFVQASTAGTGSNLTFDLAGRQSIKSLVSTELPEIYSIKVSTNTGEDNTTLILDKSQSAEYTINEDLEKWLALGTDKPQLYSMLGGLKYAYNALQVSDVQDMPLGVYTKNASPSSIEVIVPENKTLTSLLLTDHVTNTTTDLLIQNYSYTSTKGTDNSRFTLFASRVSTSELSKQVVNEVKFIQDHNQLKIENLQNATLVDVFDVSGRIIYNQNVGSSDKLKIDLPNTGVYYVRLLGGSKTIVKKIVVF